MTMLCKMFLKTLVVIFTACAWNCIIGSNHNVVRNFFCPNVTDSVSSEHLLWTRHDSERPEGCAADCYRDQRCRAFFFNTDSLLCQGHTGFPTQGWVSEAGWKHYVYCSMKDCYDVAGINNGVYTVDPADNNGSVDVYCDLSTYGGNWLVFQRRADGSVNFTRNWVEYKEGFGNLRNEFWLGNDNINRLTSQRAYELQIILKDFEGNTCVSNYSDFALSDENDFFSLTVSGYSGECGNSFSYGNGRNFSTYDMDNDSHNTTHCAASYPSGWWFGACHSSQLNGRYNYTGYAGGVVWNLWRGYRYSLMFTEMRMRPKNP